MFVCRYNRYNKDEDDIVHYGGSGSSSSDIEDFINDNPEESNYETSEEDNNPGNKIKISANREIFKCCLLVFFYQFAKWLSLL